MATYVLPGDLKYQFDGLWAEFQKEHPDLFVDLKEYFVGLGTKEEKRVSMAAERLALTSERNRLWREKLGLPFPQVPSQQDQYREASCLKCRDSRWLQQISVDKNGDRVYGDAMPCPDCVEDEKERRMMAYSGIPSTQRMASFDNFRAVKGSEEALKSAKALVSGAQFFMLLIYGGYGSGKTHLSYAAVLQALKQGMKAKFIYIPEFMGKLRQQIDLGEDLQATIDNVKAITFLALDDFGAEQGTPWQQAILEEIINHRYANCLYTIVTTNKDIKTIPGPILSRFQDTQMSKIVFDEAPDYRKKKTKAGK
jgi:DNA replication protein DnaC